VREVARVLADEGLLAGVDGTTSRNAIARVRQIPAGLRAVIGQRLHLLGGDTCGVLAVAAVLGSDFTLPSLAAVSGLDPGRLTAALEEAVRAGVLEDRSQAGALCFRFAHAYFRQSLYDDL